MTSHLLTRSARRGWSQILAAATLATLGATAAPALAQSPAPEAIKTSTQPAPLLAQAPALPTADPSSVPSVSPQTASDLRVTLNDLLEEHTYLAGAASGALVGGRPDEAQAAATALDVNTQELGNLVGSVYGSSAQQQFLQLWRRHIADYAQYAEARVNSDQAGQDQARQDLQSFASDFDTFFSGLNPSIPAGSLTNGMMMHVMGTLDVIDAQNAMDWNRAYTLARQGADMTAMMGDPLAAAIAQQFPNQLPANAPSIGGSM